MRPPLWIINIAFLILALLAIGFVFFSREKVPYREDVEPVLYTQPLKTEVSKINLSKIYEDDLFDTYHHAFPEPTEKSIEMPIPEPPAPRQPHVEPLPAPTFLDPLKITLKGIITVSGDDAQNIAIIADNKTNKEANYRIGDSIEDAQLLRIFRHKVVFIRSNGQQEVLYLRQQDAKQDPAFALNGEWEDVAKKTADNEFTVNPTEFAKRVPTLSIAMDLFDLTTVYKKGKSIGVRIGKLADNSLAHTLGFDSGDIITTINGISTAESANKLKIYQAVTSVKSGDILTISLLRNSQPLSITIKIEDFDHGFAEQLETEDEPESTKEHSDESYKERLRILHAKEKFAPTVREIQKQERRNMMQKGKAFAIEAQKAMTEEESETYEE